MKQSTNKVEFILDEYEYFEDLYIENGASDVRLVKTKRPNVRVVADNYQNIVFLSRNQSFLLKKSMNINIELLLPLKRIISGLLFTYLKINIMIFQYIHIMARKLYFLKL